MLNNKMNTNTKKIIKLAVIGTLSLILILALADRTNRRDLGMWSKLWWPQYDPQNPHEIYGTYPVKLQYHARKRRPGSGWDSPTISHTKAHIEKGSIQIDKIGIHLLDEKNSIITTYPNTGAEKVVDEHSLKVINYHIGGPNVNWPHPCECSLKHQNIQSGELIIGDDPVPCTLTINYKKNEFNVRIYPSNTNNFPEVELEVFRLNN